MVLAGVVVVALTILFSLTALALAAGNRLDGSLRVTVALAGALVVGTALLLLE